ncbi:hypothetical protein [Acidovorax sp. A1169]|uniref:hypothetical protein n=1 Tax=Acidovorax sp. A1169 TaxID=3059524 RepID=UPI002737CC6E|nr:hypothetical protein [Acidovorax sp. A1169]
MKERPILFSGAMVRALLNGSKTQTRRICKPAANLSAVVEVPDPAERGQVYNGSHFGDEDGEVQFACPYGGRGDRLWVRETWQGPLLKEFETDADADWHTPARIHQYQNPAHCAYAADGGPAPEFFDLDDNLQQRWRPSIHMPRWASRLTLELASVRVERLQDISEADALAEGIVRQPDGGYGLADTTHYHATDPRICYWSLWDHINGAGSVESNPFVWVLGFPSTTTPAQP